MLPPDDSTYRFVNIEPYLTGAGRVSCSHLARKQGANVRTAGYHALP